MTIADLQEDGKTPDLRESLMVIKGVMVGSTEPKHSRRSEVGMGSGYKDALKST